MNAKISVFVICVEAIIYLLLYNLHGCTFKQMNNRRRSENLIKSIESFFNHQDRDIQESFHEQILEICRKENFLFYFFVVFFVGVFIIIYSLLCFTITNQKLKQGSLFILALERNKKKSEKNRLMISKINF